MKPAKRYPGRFSGPSMTTNAARAANALKGRNIDTAALMLGRLDNPNTREAALAALAKIRSKRP